MKLLPLLIVLACLVVSCSSSNSEKLNSDIITKGTLAIIDTLVLDTINEVKIVDKETQVTFTKAQQKFHDDTLVKFMTSDEIQLIKRAMIFRDSIKTPEDMFVYYTNILPELSWKINDAMYNSFPEVLYSGDDEPARGWRSISKFIPELYTDCPCSECTSMAYINLTGMQKLANKTKGEEDDYFFILQTEVYDGNFIDETFDKEEEEEEEEEEEPILHGHGGGFYISDHCDVCSFMSFGNDFHYRMYEFILTHKWNIFKDEVNQLYTRDYFNKDQMVFYYDKEDVIVELHDLQTLQLPGEYMKIINKILSQVQSNKNVYFGCQNYENNCPTP